jgi:hypothetical protein
VVPRLIGLLSHLGRRIRLVAEPTSPSSGCAVRSNRW